jgi:opacity protein-like surface antigen
MKPSLLKACVLRGAAALSLAVPASAWAEPPGFTSVWQTEVSAYAWASGVAGNAQVGRVPDADYSDNSGKLNSGILSIETGQNDSGLMLDAFHSKLSQDSDLMAGGKFGRARLDGTHKVLQLAGASRISGNDPELFIDFIGGLRHGRIELEQRFTGAEPCSDRESWTNGFIGLRVMERMSERWWMVLYGDAGGGGGHTSWQGQLGANFRMTDAATFKFGYRILGLKSEKPGFDYDLRTGGVYAGLGMRF